MMANTEQAQEAFRELIEACERDFCSMATEDESDDTPVASGFGDDHSAVTFGMIRRARAALAASPSSAPG